MLHNSIIEFQREEKRGANKSHQVSVKLDDITYVKLMEICKKLETSSHSLGKLLIVLLKHPEGACSSTGLSSRC